MDQLVRFDRFFGSHTRPVACAQLWGQLSKSLTVALIIVSACTPMLPTGVQSGPGGSLVVGINTQLTTFDPNKPVPGPEVAMWHQVYDYLVAVQQSEPRIRPWLAESWSVSPDGRTYVFTLKRGVKFHDGTKFDADAAKRNFDRLSSGATNVTVRSIAANLVGAIALDETTLRIDLKSPSAGFLSSLDAVPMISPTAAEQWGQDYGQHPVGTGPFKLKEWIPQDHLVLERNPDYAWPPSGSSNAGPAHLDSVTVKFVVDPPARLLSLESGDTQVVTYVPLQDAARLANDPRFKVVTGSSIGMPLVFYMNVRAGPTADPQVRIAIHSALDGAELIQLGGYSQPVPASGLLTSAIRCSSTGFVDSFPHDPGRAKELLDAAGWLVGSDGIRQKGATRLAFDLVHFPDYVALATTIQAELREIGVEANLKVLDFAAGANLLRSGQPGASLVAGTINDPTGLNSLLHSRAIGTSVLSTAIPDDTQLDGMLDQAAAEPDAAKQCQLYTAFQMRYLQSTAAYPIWEVPTTVGLRSDVRGVRLVPTTGIMPLFQEIYLDALR
jgi:peptide/nickel transport system substrate-binding protein